MDDLGVPHGLETSVDHNYLWLVIPLIHQVVRSCLLLKVTHVQVKLPNKQCSNPRPLILPGQFFWGILILMDYASLESNIAAWLGIPLYQRYEWIMIIPI